MATTDLSSNTEIEGQLVDVIHVDTSGTEPVRTVLALATKDDLSVSFDEGSESFERAVQRRTNRFRTSNEIDVEITQALSTDLDALEKVGIVDADGTIDFSDAARDLPAEEFLELGFHSDELDYETDPGPLDYEQMHRLRDVETVLDDIDPSEVPPTLSFSVMVEGDYELDAGAL